MDIGDDVTEICKTEFKGLKGESMQFKVYGNNFSDFKVYEEDGMYTAEVNIFRQTIVHHLKYCSRRK
uniref:Uncharacterized protein n=1 Tax=Panagrolaimus superbus TaxID=310955 RepID=A0A914YH24_9BILA